MHRPKVDGPVNESPQHGPADDWIWGWHAVEAAELMERHRVTGLLVVDRDGRLVGAINSNDLMRAKVI